MRIFPTQGPRPKGAVHQASSNCLTPNLKQSAANRAGAAVVEFAAIAPVIFLFVLGLIEASRGFMIVHQLNNAARVGCRVGVLEGSSSATIKQKVKDTLVAHGITPTEIKVLVNNADGEASTANSKDRITVVTSIAFEDFTWLPGGSFVKGNIGSQYSLHRE